MAKQQESHAWPPLSKLNFYSGPPTLMFSTEDRLFDLSDNITESLNQDDHAIIYFGLSAPSQKWPVWSEDNMRAIERLIKQDLEHDGFNVDAKRITDSCKTESRRHLVAALPSVIKDKRSYPL